MNDRKEKKGRKRVDDRKGWRTEGGKRGRKEELSKRKEKTNSREKGKESR